MVSVVRVREKGAVQRIGYRRGDDCSCKGPSRSEPNANFPGMGLFSKSNNDSKQSNATTKSKSVSVKLPSSNRLADYAHKSPRLVEQKSRHKLTMAITHIDIPPAPDPRSHPAAYLRSIYSVRQRSRLVFQKARTNQLKHFDVDEAKFKDVADYVVSIIKVRKSTFLVSDSD